MQAKKQDKKVLLQNEIEQSSFKAIANQKHGPPAESKAQKEQRW